MTKTLKEEIRKILKEAEEYENVWSKPVVNRLFNLFDQKLKEQREELLKEIKRLVNKGNDWDTVIEELLNK